MKPTRLLCAALIPLCALALSLLWLHNSASAALPANPISETNPKPYAELSITAASFWPPFHIELSNSADRDSGGADIAAEEDRIAIVWAEGASAQGVNDGRVKLAWRPSRSSPWRTRIVPQQLDGYVHYQPAVALQGQTAHIVWVRKDVEGAALGSNQISYAQCMLDTGVCSSPVRVSPEGAAYSRMAPDIAVDAAGTPHVVWVRQNHEQIGRILYNNRKGGVWNTPEIISGQEGNLYSQDNPALTLDSQRVYVVWDENGGTIPQEETVGIYFRQREQIDLPSGDSGVTWSPGGTPLGKQISAVPAGTQIAPPDVDGFPTLDAGAGRVYVMWERLAYTQTMSFYGAVYTYSLPYRVYTGTVPDTDWWPGGAAADQHATMPFTSTSATDTADFYQGLRPSLKLAGPVPHVVWHRWDAPQPFQQNDLELQSELSDEHLIDDQHPYRVSHATYRPGTDLSDLPLAESRWVSETLYALEYDHILASPDLAFSTIDGGSTYQLHVTLHQRGSYVPEQDSFGWDVWYTNNEDFYRIYLPLMHNHRP